MRVAKTVPGPSTVKSKNNINCTVNLPNFEHAPYFEHHVNKNFSKSTAYKFINLVHEDLLM